MLSPREMMRSLRPAALDFTLGFVGIVLAFKFRVKLLVTTAHLKLETIRIGPLLRFVTSFNNDGRQQMAALETSSHPSTLRWPKRNLRTSSQTNRQHLQCGLQRSFHLFRRFEMRAIIAASLPSRVNGGGPFEPGE